MLRERERERETERQRGREISADLESAFETLPPKT